jgi:hypothetical protein
MRRIGTPMIADVEEPTSNRLAPPHLSASPREKPIKGVRGPSRRILIQKDKRNLE